MSNGCSQVRDVRTGQVLSIPHPQSDIDRCIAFSYTRCLLSLFSLLLVLTDIPRTGASIDVFSYYTKVGPGVAMYYGPYSYPAVHLNRSSSMDITGYVGDTAVERVDMWAYKYDTLSIPFRAMVQHLDISNWPPCVMYDSSKCVPGDSTIPVSTVFAMLDAWISAVHTKYFYRPSERRRAVHLQTLSRWVDRIHHVILGGLTHRIDKRLHGFYSFVPQNSTSGVQICDHHRLEAASRLIVCDLPIVWLADHPTLGPTTQIPVVESISLRFAMQQALYPTLELDLTVITTRSFQKSMRKHSLSTVFYASDNQELTTLIRARRCDTIHGNCTTVAIDDYRYERATIETPSDEMMGILSSLRLLSQGYVWLRLLLLLYICGRTRLSELKCRSMSLQRKLCVVAWTILQIPSHVIIYGSWVPLIGYSIAHLSDCTIVHLISDNFWSTPNGFFSFNFVQYVVVATIQMRNIWVIALTWKCIMLVYAKVNTHRQREWHPRDGVYALRTLFISLVSFLTIFSMLRAIRFRDTTVTHVQEVPRNTGLESLSLAQERSGRADFGFMLDVKTTAIASVIVLAFGGSIQAIVRVLTKSSTSLFTCRSYYIPSSAGVLFPRSAMNVFWFIRLVRRRSGTSTRVFSSLSSSDLLRKMSTRILSSVFPSDAQSQLHRNCEICSFQPTPMHWRRTQGCIRHERIHAWGDHRSVEVQSMVRLVNIAMLSDPLTFLSVRLIGKQLYVYRMGNRTATWANRETNGAQSTPENAEQRDRLVLSPRLLSTATVATKDATLVATVSSSDVPWTLLVDCG